MSPEEKKLQYELQNGHEEAIFSLMAMYYNDLFRYGIRFTADAENTKDIVNQFFLHLWDHRERFAAAENIKAYLIVSFKRFLVDQLRKSFPFTNIADYPDELMEHSYEDYIIQFEDDESLRVAMHRSIQALPARQKELLVLRFYENLSYEEIAARNSLSVRTVYNKIHLALKKLRSLELFQQIRKNGIFRRNQG
jgi:RNA polymerase sigma-70 factor (ECF subfamily)